MVGSIDSPMWPAMMPAKNTKVTPKDMPHMRIFPKARPTAIMTEIIITACRGEWLRNMSESQFMLQN